MWNLRDLHLQLLAVPKDVVYRPTPKPVAANCANQLKARADPKGLIYRLTPKRLAAWRASLEKANAAP